MEFGEPHRLEGRVSNQQIDGGLQRELHVAVGRDLTQSNPSH